MYAVQIFPSTPIPQTFNFKTIVDCFLSFMSWDMNPTVILPKDTSD